MRKRTKLITIAIVGFAVLLLAGGGAIWYFQFFKNQSSEKDSSTQTPGQLVTAKTTQTGEIAQETYAEGGFNAAVQQYDTALKDSDIPSNDKGELQRGKASLYLNENKLDEALIIALEADNNWSTRFTTSLIADIHFGLGNKDEAIRYYNLAIERIATDGYGELPFNDEAYYKERIEIVNNS
jgi:tetratricopeptide (TPR) repeat protein